MTACTLQDLQELNKQLMCDLARELSTRLRKDLRAELEAVFAVNNRSSFSVRDLSFTPQKNQDEFAACEPRNSTHANHDVCMRLGSEEPSRQAVETKNERAEEEWRAHFWISSDETEWLLSKPFGPSEIPGDVHAGAEHVDANNCRSMCLSVDSTPDPAVMPGVRSYLKIVEASWFQALSALVIIVNIALSVVEINDPTTHYVLTFPNQLILIFYVLELLARLCYYGSRFWHGPRSVVVWNFVDFGVVITGVLEQLVVPLFPGLVGSGHVRTVLQMCRCLRLVRVVKIIRVFLSSDLSWAEEPAFQSFIGLVIAFNALLMGLETDIQWAGWFWIEQALLVVYIFELAVRVKSAGIHFFCWDNPDFNWNCLDVLIVGSSTLDSWLLPLYFLMTRDILETESHGTQQQRPAMGFGQAMMFMRMLRLLRILRLAKLVKAFKPLYILVASVLAAVQGVFWVLVLTAASLYATGIFATRIIGHAVLFQDPNLLDPAVRHPFRTVADSMFTLFRFMNGSSSDSESKALDTLMDFCPGLKFAFVFFTVSSSWTLLSILTAVVSDTMISTTGTQEYEMKLASDEHDHKLHVQNLKSLFEEVDQTKDGSISVEELNNFLRVPKNANRTASMCRVPPRDVVAVLSTVATNGEIISEDEFVEYLSDVGAIATEKSIMKLEARLKQLQRSMAALLRYHNLKPLKNTTWQLEADMP